MAQRNAVFPAGRHDLFTAHAYSAAIKSGDLLFVSGQVGSRSDGSPEPDFEAQVRLAFANLRATLEVGGCGLDDIVDVTTFHTDPEHQFGTIMAVKSLPGSALSELDGDRGQLARGVRLRDQGHRPNPWLTITKSTVQVFGRQAAPLNEEPQPHITVTALRAQIPKPPAIFKVSPVM